MTSVLQMLSFQYVQNPSSNHSYETYFIFTVIDQRGKGKISVAPTMLWGQGACEAAVRFVESEAVCLNK